MRIIDAHQHLWDASAVSMPWMDGPWADPLRARFDHAALAREVAANGIAATVVVQADASVAETRQLLAIAAESGIVAGVVGWADLTAPDVADHLALLQAAPGGGKLTGIRHLVQDEPDPGWLVRPEVVRGLRAVARAGLVYDLLVRPPQLAAAAEVVRLLPELVFVLDHLGKPDIARRGWEPWASALTRLAAAPNVSAKLSGLVTEADWSGWKPGHFTRYVRHAIEAFGPERLMFGSDWPVCTLAAPYTAVVDLMKPMLGGLGRDERASVFAGTAERVYGLPVPS